MRILLTRSREGNRAWARELAERGVDAVPVDCLEHRPVDDPAVRLGLERVWRTASCLAFTSPRGVEATAKLLPAEQRRSPGPRLAAVGPTTAEACCRCFGRCDIESPEPSARGLGEHLARVLKPGDRVATAVADRGRRELEDVLTGSGFPVERWTVYRTVPRTPGPGEAPLELASLGLDAVWLASPSAWEGLQAVARLPADRSLPVVAIGPTTASAVAGENFDVVVAAEPSLDGMLGALRAFKPRRSIAADEADTAEKHS